MIAAPLIALALTTSAAPAGPYTLEVSVVRYGVETMTASGLITENQEKEILVSNGTRKLHVNAELSDVQESGDESRLLLSTEISTESGDTIKPSVSLRRGGMARIVVGEDDSRILVNLTPASQEQTTP